MRIRQNIQRILKEKNIEQKKMLKDLGLGQNYISQMKDPTISKLLKICEYLQVDIQDLLK